MGVVASSRSTSCALLGRLAQDLPVVLVETHAWGGEGTHASTA